MRKIDIVIGILFVLSTIALGVILLPLQIIPAHMAILLFFVIIALNILYGFSSMIIHTSMFHRIRRSLGLCFSCLLIVASIGLLEFDHTISQMTDIEDKTIHIRLIARVEQSDELSKYQNQTVGIYAHDYDSQKQFLDALKTQENITLKTKNFEDAQHAYEAMLQGQVAGIIVTEKTYDDLDQRYQISGKTRLVYEYVIEPLANDLLHTPFHILIQGIDQVGSSAKLARSDVNMIASVNLDTKQILLTSIPRDTYMQNPCLGGKYDKLTHISLQGSQCSLDALSSYFGIPLSYYVKVSFTSVIEIIDIIGGVTIDVPMTFCEYDETGKHVIHIKKGKQTLDGRKALAFARHRYTLYDGDMGRNRNQQLLINALIKKTASPKLLTQIDAILNIMETTVTTNLEPSQIYSLIRFHLDDARPYLIENQSIRGTTDMKVTASMPYQKLSVVIPSSESIKHAADAMTALIEPIDLSDFTYSASDLRIPEIRGETTGAKGTNRCHL